MGHPGPWDPGATYDDVPSGDGWQQDELGYYRVSGPSYHGDADSDLGAYRDMEDGYRDVENGYYGCQDNVQDVWEAEEE